MCAKKIAPTEEPIVECWIKPKIDKGGTLKGPYPKYLSLVDADFPTNIHIHTYKVFKDCQERGIPVPANLRIASDIHIEHLTVPNDAIGVDYIIVENLPNLRTLVVGQNLGQSSLGELQWLVLRNLPRLVSVKVIGPIRWLEIDSSESLESVCLSQCPNLDYLAISGCRRLSDLQIDGCLKLRKVLRIGLTRQKRLRLKEQIKANQDKSRLDGSIYKNMTFTDLDIAKRIINSGVKIATRMGKLPEDFCYGQESNRKFRSFSYELLRPLEQVYTGGTGETYAYTSLCHDYYEHQGVGIWNAMGYRTPEDCLEGFLSTAVQLGLQSPKQSRRGRSDSLAQSRMYLASYRTGKLPRDEALAFAYLHELTAFRPR